MNSETKTNKVAAGLTLKQILARNAKKAPNLAQEGSVRLSEDGSALRYVPVTGGKDRYPCVFRWEVTDQRLKERFETRLAKGELAPNQIAWYMNRLGFRAVKVSAPGVA